MNFKYSLLVLLLSLFLISACKKDQKKPATNNSPADSQLQAYGLGTHLDAEKSLNKDYNYYFDQFDGSQYQGINCGPAVTTMAIRWADPDFSKNPVDARNVIPENGGWWYTPDIDNYLNLDNINHIIVQFNSSTANDIVKNSIDNNNLLILCLDMFYVDYNPLATQHTNKFYGTAAKDWGHFLLVKGYKQVDGKLYYEIYDPYTNHETYQDNSPKGKDRYYLNTNILAATNVWWKYAFIVAPKGQQVIASTKLKINSMQNIPVAGGK
jgi:hypothetical protein